jgi:hypothetical protein
MVRTLPLRAGLGAGLLCAWMTLAAAPLAAAGIKISGHVYDGDGNGLRVVRVTVVFDKGDPVSTSTDGTGRYEIGPLTPPGKIVRIEYSKQGVGHKEYYDLADRDDLKISIILGARPTNFFQADVRLAEIDRLLLRAAGDPASLTKESKAYLQDPMLKKELQALPRDVTGASDEAKKLLQEKANALETRRKGLKID